MGLNFYSLFEEQQNFLYANRIATDGMPHNAASHLGLYCLCPIKRMPGLYKLIDHCVAVQHGLSKPGIKKTLFS